MAHVTQPKKYYTHRVGVYVKSTALYLSQGGGMMGTFKAARRPVQHERNRGWVTGLKRNAFAVSSRRPSLERRTVAALFLNGIYERQRAKLNDPWGDAVAAKLTARQITEAQTARIRFCTVTLAQNVDRGCCQDKRSHASKRDKR